MHTHRLKLIDSIILLSAIATALATSYADAPYLLKTGSYRVHSDCAGSEKDGLVTVMGTENTDPRSKTDDGPQILDGQRFGFPSNTLSGLQRRQDGYVTIESRSGDKYCRLATWGNPDTELLFVCFEGEKLQCTIHLSAESTQESTQTP